MTFSIDYFLQVELLSQRTCMLLISINTSKLVFELYMVPMECPEGCFSSHTLTNIGLIKLCGFCQSKT